MQCNTFVLFAAIVHDKNSSSYPIFANVSLQMQIARLGSFKLKDRD